jgi:raffinose/stachyose/melibiose transport system permease protein
VGAQSLLARASQGQGVRRFWSRYGVSYTFILPAVVLYIVFVLYPFARSFYISLTDWNGFDPVMNFIGLDNYLKLLQDPLFWTAFSHNIIWIIVGSIGAIGLGLFLAILVSSRPPGFLIFRTVYFMPQVLGPAIVGVIWLLIYAPRRGFLYKVGEATGLDFLQRSLLANPQTALLGILFASIWASIGFFFVIFLAGLQNVDRDLLDAARVDGANSWQQFWNVTVPQLSHVITMVIALGMIGSLKVFDIVWTMTQGGPANSSEVLGTLAYQESFNHTHHGYGSAIIMVTSALAVLMSVVFIRLRERRGG